MVRWVGKTHCIVFAELQDDRHSNNVLYVNARSLCALVAGDPDVTSGFAAAATARRPTF